MKDIWFIIGPPGSKWSSLYNLLSVAVANVDNTDKTVDRFYTHGNNITHQGAYFGPGMEFGSNWHLEESITRDNLLAEIGKVWPVSNQVKLVKSHVLALHLPKLRSEFPNSKFIFVTRPYERSIQGWIGAGGFEKITYPNYKEYYKDDETFCKLVSAESESISRYKYANNLPTHLYSKTVIKEYFTIDENNLNNAVVNDLDAHLLSHSDVSITVEN